MKAASPIAARREPYFPVPRVTAYSPTNTPNFPLRASYRLGSEYRPAFIMNHSGVL